MSGAPSQWQQRPGVPPLPPRRFSKARRLRALLTAGTLIALLLGTVGYGVYRHLGPDPACGNARDAAAREPDLSADLSARNYDDLDSELAMLHESLTTGEQRAFFPFDSQVGTAKADTEIYQKDVYRIRTPHKLHLYKATPDMLAADQKKVFADISGLRTHCGS